MILFGEDSLRNAVHHFVEHYHLERNHQGLDNRLITPIGTRFQSDPVRKRQRLVGMLNYYYRGAA
jgi:putative transposase